MTNIFIIHGAYGNPEENWFPWLKFELEKLDCRVFVPKFPTPENQSLENWLKVFEDYKQYLNENSIVVGHSLGSVFLLNILENLDKPIKAAFFVSGFVGLLGNPDFDNINESFVDKSFDWQKIKQNCKKFYIFHSDNDPYIPLEKAKELAKNLGVNIIFVKDAGHFNEKTGYTKFGLLLEKIKNELITQLPKTSSLSSFEAHNKHFTARTLQVPDPNSPSLTLRRTSKMPYVKCPP